MTAQRRSLEGAQFQPGEALQLQFSDKTQGEFRNQQPQPLALISADLDEDGVADLVIGYGLNKGGAIAFSRGNLDALAPQTHESWLAAGQGRYASPFLASAKLISVPEQPDVLAVADANGDGHKDLIFAARNGHAVYVLLGDGNGQFVLQTPVPVPGAITALAAYRPGNTAADALIVGIKAGSNGELVLFQGAKTGLQQRSVYPLPGTASAIEIADLDSDFTPDAAIVADGQLLVLHGQNALEGNARLEALPISGVEAVTAGSFLFDRHAQLQLAALTTDGTVHILADSGFDSRPYTREEIAATRRVSGLVHSAPSLAQKAGNTGDQSWVEVESHAGVAPHDTSAGTPLLLHAKASGSGEDLLVLNSSQQEIVSIRHSAQPASARIDAVTQSHVLHSSLASGDVVAAVSQALSPQGVHGLVVLHRSSIQPNIVLPSAGNTFYVNATTDALDASDGVRCTQGGAEQCTLRDAITFANNDGAANISAGKSDIIMVPSGTYTLTYQAGTVDANGNEQTHLEILGPVTIIGSTSGGGVVIDANSSDTVFTINPGIYGSYNPSGNSYVFDTTLENLTIENGKNNNNLANNTNANNVGGGINWDAFGTGNLTLTNLTVKNCTVLWGPGGGIWAQNSAGSGNGTLTITSSTITGNSTPEEGGAVYVAFPPAALSSTNTTFSSNKAQVAVNPGDSGANGTGGGFFFTGSATPRTTLTGATVTSNAADVDGGGFYTNAGIILSSSMVSNNSTGRWGGGLFSELASPEQPTSITGSTFLNNSATTAGGGILVGPTAGSAGNALQITTSRIFGNTSSGGANGLSDGDPGGTDAGNVAATENWWGCNGGPTTASDGCDQAAHYGSTGSLTTDPHIVLTLGVSPNTVALNDPLTLTAAVNTDSSSGSVPGGPGALQGVNVSLQASVGSFTDNTSGAINSSGTTTASVTPTSSGSGTATATLDNATVNATFTVSAGPATHLSISAPATATSYTTFQITVTALDVSNGVATGYTGTVHFTSSDPGAVFTANNVTLTNGVGTFNMALKTASPQTVTATDTVNASITGSTSIQVNPGPATRFSVSAPATANAGTAFNFTATALDLYGNIATGYTGTLHFTSTDGAAALPANATLTNGVGAFSATLNTAGNQSITATDTVTSTITGTSNTIAVSASTTLTVVASPNLVVYGQPTSVTATITPAAAGSSPISDFSAVLDGTQALTVISLGGNQFQITGPFTTLNVSLHSIKVSFSGTTNYLPSQGTATLAVNQASQTISFPAIPSPVTFGVAPITLNATASVVAPGGGSGLPVSYSVTGPATVSGNTLTITGAGTVVVTAMQTGNTNYAPATPVSQTIVVNKATPTLTWPAPAPITYGTALTGAQLDASATGVGGASLPGAFSYTPAAGSVLNVGPQTLHVTFTPTDTTDYTTATSSVTLTVNQASQTIAFPAIATPVTFGVGPITLTATASSSLPVSYTVTGPATIGGSTLSITGAGTVVVTATQAGNTNYAAATPVSQTILVNKATSTLTWPTPAPVTYGTALSNTQLDATATGVGGASLAGTFAYTPVAGTVLSGGQQTLQTTFTPTDTTDYTTGTASVTLTVNTATTALTLVNQTTSPVYGSLVTFKGAFTPANANVTSSNFQFITDAGTPNQGVVPAPAYTNGTVTVTYGQLTAGSHTAVVKFLGTADYAAANSNVVSLTVAQAQPTVSWTLASAIGYGTNLAGLLTAKGSFNNQPQPGTVTYTAQPSGGSAVPVTSTTVLNAGTYTLTATFTPTDTTNYATATEAVALTVTKVALTVTPANETKLYGAALPALAGTITGLVNGDNITATYATTATASSPVGTYPITATLNDPSGRLPNYSITLNQGTLTVTQYALTVTANNATKIYGTADPTFTGTVTGAVNGDMFTAIYTTPATIASNAGSYPITPAVTGADLSSYAVSYVNGTLTINKAAATESLSASVGSVFPGQPVTLTSAVASTTSGTPTGTVSFYDGSALLGTATLSGGQATYTTTTLTAGAHSITAAYGGDNNFLAAAATSGTAVTIASPDFTLSGGGGAQTVIPGNGATFSFGVTPAAGALAAPVSFSVAGLPAGATASFNPSSLPANSTGGQVQLTIQTATPSATAALRRVSGGFALAMLLFPFLGMRSMRRRAGLLLMLLLGAVGMAGLSGCGANNGTFAQTPKDYAVTVTVTSDSIQHTMDFTLNLQ